MPRLALLLLPPRPLHDEHPAERSGDRLEPREQLDQRGDGPGDERVERIAGRAPCDQLLRRTVVDRQRVAGRGEDPAHRPGLLADAVDKLDTEVGPEEGEDHAGDATTGPHVEHPLPGRQVGRDRDRIGDVAGDELPDVGVPGEIDLFVATPERRRIPRQRPVHLRRHGQTQAIACGADRLGQCRAVVGNLPHRGRVTHLMNNISR